MLVLRVHLAPGRAGAGGADASELGFSRIVHGWTNYSTAFNATHDVGTRGDYATIASLYMPMADVLPTEYGVIVIGSGLQAPPFAAFQFRVMIWNSMEAFILEPWQGSVRTWDFVAPSGGSTTVPDATTRGGRPAFELRFSLTNNSVTLSNGATYVIGFAARTETQSNGELFVPTSNHPGPSDLQAGDLVVGGWQYLVNAGGSTIYSGELAVDLVVRAKVIPPRMTITRAGDFIRMSWPASRPGFLLQFSLSYPAQGDWSLVEAEPFEENGTVQVVVPAGFNRQWFRLQAKTE